MGHMIEKVLAQRGIPLVEASENITATDPEVAKECVCVDFTTPDAFRANYPFIAKHFKAAVVGTTGWNDIEADVFKAFEEAGTTLIYASNFSLKASALLKGADYTPSIEEIHHSHKLDAPSGTAKSLGKLVEEGLGVTPEITAIREGEVPGIHTVTYESACDKLTFRHEAYSLEGLAVGAVVAVTLTEGLKGVHEFGDLL